MIESAKLKRNILLLGFIASFTWLRFFIPVIVLFYAASQVPIEQFGIIFGVFSATILVMTLPGGVIADLLGKKKSMFIAHSCYATELIIMAFCNGFWPLLIAKIISGIGFTLSTGSFGSLLYDTLKALGRESEHKRISGTISTISNTMIAIVFSVGSYLFTISPKLPAYASIPGSFICLSLIIMLTEVVIPHKKLTMQNSLLHLKEAWGFLSQSHSLKYLAIFVAVFSTTTTLQMSYSSGYYEQIGVAIALFGIIAFVTNIMTALGNKFAHRVEKMVGQKKSLIICATLLMLSLIGIALAIPVYGVIFFLLLFFAQGMQIILSADSVHKLAQSSHRASQVSLNSMLASFGGAIMYPLVGIVSKNIGLLLTLQIFSSVFALFLLILIIYALVKKDLFLTQPI